MKKPSITSVTLMVSLLLTLSTRSAHAYLDPGTGSMIFQVALASLFGVLLAIKTFWVQIKHFVLANILRKPVAEVEPSAKSKKAKS
jgi:hypothetical protein